MKTEAEWTEDVKRVLRAEMARRGITYGELAQRLASVDLRDKEVNSRNKVARVGSPRCSFPMPLIDRRANAVNALKAASCRYSGLSTRGTLPVGARRLGRGGAIIRALRRPAPTAPRGP